MAPDALNVTTRVALDRVANLPRRSVRITTMPNFARKRASNEREAAMRVFGRSTIGGLALSAMLATGCGTLTGAAVGAGTGAAVGYGTGYGAGKGALIGTGVGAAAGVIYDIYRHDEN
jgi:hypothetical protein